MSGVNRLAAVLVFPLALGGIVQLPTSLENLPTGQYYYENVAGGRVEQGYILLRKIGRTVVGIDGRSRTQSPCFRGFLEGDRIVDATRIYPPYHTDSRWDAHRGEMVDLGDYQRVNRAITDEQAETLITCLRIFSR